jgi:hypothetical protein
MLTSVRRRAMTNGINHTMNHFCRYRTRVLAALLLAFAAFIASGSVASAQVYQKTFDILAGDTLSVLHAISNLSPNPSDVSVDAGLYNDPGLKQSAFVKPVPIKKSQHKGKDNQGNYDLIAAFSIDNGGTYFLAMNIRGKSINAGEGVVRGQIVWKINVHWPQISLVPKPRYSYGELAYVNFSAGHQDYSGYSYRVSRGSTGEVLFHGNGSVIPIDSIWRIDSLMIDSTFVVEGLYRNKPFSFVRSAGAMTQETKWTVVMQKPGSLSHVSLWTQEGKFVEQEKKVKQSSKLPRVDMALHDGWIHSRLFRFTFESDLGEGNVVMTNPMAFNIQVKSEPPGFLMQNRFSFAIDRVWSVIEIKPSPDFLRGLTPALLQKVVIDISFTDKFGNPNRYRFKTQVFSSENQ